MHFSSEINKNKGKKSVPTDITGNADVNYS